MFGAQTFCNTNRIKVFRNRIKRWNNISLLYDEGTNALTQTVVRQTDGCVRSDSGAPIKIIIYFVGRDVDAAADKDFFLAAVDLYSALFILDT